MKNNKQKIEDLLYTPEKDRSFSADRCFLCGTQLNSNSHDEHVFPKWLQHEFNLWDKSYYLLNGTTIHYRYLTIPCCKTCNTKYLSKIENIVQEHYNQGYDKLKNINRHVLFLWLSKIFYGVLFKELLLPFDRTDSKNNEKIISDELFEQYDMLHTFLQGARIPMKFVGFHPWSIFIFQSQKSKNIDLNFDYKDSLFSLVIFLRIGEISIICCLQDNGVQEIGFSDWFSKFQDIKLHPIQSVEIFSQIAYKNFLLNRVPKYMMVYSDKSISVLSSPIQGFSNKPIFDDWIQEEYAQFLSFHTQIPIEKIYVPQDKVWTWLYKEDKSINIMNGFGEFK